MISRFAACIKRPISVCNTTRPVLLFAFSFYISLQSHLKYCFVFCIYFEHTVYNTVYYSEGLMEDQLYFEDVVTLVK